MPSNRSLRPQPLQLIWLVAVIAVGVIVGIVAGPWWGVGAAVVMLLLGDVVERVLRSRR